MTTLIGFTRNSQTPFQFQPTLDGQVYTVTVTWALFGQRWYINITALDGTLIVSLPLIGSPPAASVASLSWDDSGTVMAQTAAPHGLALGSVAMLTVSGAVPQGYNGVFPCAITGPASFTYGVATNPGQMTAAGNFSTDINLVGGYFTTSTLVYRVQNQQFEVNP